MGAAYNTECCSSEHACLERKYVVVSDPDNESAALTCTKGHGLQEQTLETNDSRCCVCGLQLWPPDRLYHCSICNYNLCTKCAREAIESVIGDVKSFVRVDAIKASMPREAAKKLSVNLPDTLQSRIGHVTEDKLKMPYDVIVLGGGPAGVAAGLKAAYMGRRALIVDKPKIRPKPNGLDVSFGGPTGLFSKALRDVSKTLNMESKRLGAFDNEEVWEQVLDGCNRLASMNAVHQIDNLQKFKVDYLQAHGQITSTVTSSNGGPERRTIMARTDDGKHHALVAENVLIATGSKPRRPSEVPYDDYRIFDSDTINSCKFLPTSVAIIGSGIIAIEYAAIFRKLGAEVYILVRSSAKQALKRIGLDPDISNVLLDVLKQDSVKIFEETSVMAWKIPASRLDLIQLQLSSPEGMTDRIDVDLVLAAIGREPRTANLGLEDLGVELERGKIKVDPRFATSVPGIFAAGDVVGPPSLAATGVYQAQGAVLGMFEEGTVDQNVSFSVAMWTIPECGFYGLTKDAAERDGLVVEEGLAPYSACLRGRVFAPEGVLKLVFTKDAGIIVGVHIVGADACELVHYGMDLVKQRITIFEVMSQIFSAVTFHELFQEAAINGNSKLEFGLEWQEILKGLGIGSGDITKEQLRAEFDRVDTSGDGNIDAAELKAVFQNVGREVKISTVSNLMRLADENNNGTLDWSEFEKIFDKIRGTSSGTCVGESVI